MSVVKLHKLKLNLFCLFFSPCRDSPGLLKVLFLHSGHLTLHREMRGRMKFEVTLENWSQKKKQKKKTATGFVLMYSL